MSKLCKDCRWCNYDEGHDDGLEFAKCNAPQNMKSPSGDLVSGSPTESWRWTYCSTHREEPFFLDIIMRGCGKRGRWWQAKPDPNPMPDSRPYLEVISGGRDAI